MAETFRFARPVLRGVRFGRKTDGSFRFASVLLGNARPPRNGIRWGRSTCPIRFAGETEGNGAYPLPGTRFSVSPSMEGKRETQGTEGGQKYKHLYLVQQSNSTEGAHHD